jgi:antitoxin ParD1/3/4
MEVTLTKEQKAYVTRKVRSGRYSDASDVMRDALRALELRDDFESPALETALLEGVRSPHRLYSKSTLNRIRKAARRVMTVTVSISGRAEADLTRQCRYHLEKPAWKSANDFRLAKFPELGRQGRLHLHGKRGKRC